MVPLTYTDSSECTSCCVIDKTASRILHRRSQACRVGCCVRSERIAWASGRGTSSSHPCSSIRLLQVRGAAHALRQVATPSRVLALRFDERDAAGQQRWWRSRACSGDAWTTAWNGDGINRIQYPWRHVQEYGPTLDVKTKQKTAALRVSTRESDRVNMHNQSVTLHMVGCRNLSVCPKPLRTCAHISHHRRFTELRMFFGCARSPVIK